MSPGRKIRGEVITAGDAGGPQVWKGGDGHTSSGADAIKVTSVNARLFTYIQKQMQTVGMCERRVYLGEMPAICELGYRAGGASFYRLAISLEG